MEQKTIALVVLAVLLCAQECSSERLKFESRRRKNDWITKVHIVFMNHLDVGYTDFINNVLNKYFQGYFDQAIAVAASLRNLGYVENMVYTTHPWLVSLYLNCPPNMVLSGIQLKCPTQKQKDNFMRAVERGDVTWHAGPMNLQIEFMDPWLFGASLDLASDLDRMFNVTRSGRTLSQRDVPGLTQASIPIMVGKGIGSVTVGINPATPPPAVPKLFRWKYGRDSVVVHTHLGGYPNDPGPSPVDPRGLSREDCALLEGHPEALCFVFRTDNTGPPGSVQEVLGAYEIFRAEFPSAILRSGRMEDFFASIDDRTRDLLPVVTGEIGDTWIQGIASDPKKNAHYLLISDKIRRCLNSGSCSLADRRVWNASRFLAKLPEHTWGYYSEHDTSNWNNPSFEPIRNVNPNFIVSRNTWWEQRNFSLFAVEALEDHAVVAEIKDGLKALETVVPDLSGYAQTPAREFSCPKSDIKSLLFGADGSIQKLTYKNHELAGEGCILGKFVYQTFNETDFETFGKVYNYNGWSAGYYKPNCTASAHPESKTWATTLAEVYASKKEECDLWLKVVMADKKTVSWYGAPAQVWIRYVARKSILLEEGSSTGLDVTLMWFNKTTTRLPESISLAFRPIRRDGQMWTVYKMWSPVDPYNVVLNGSQYNHVASLNGVEYEDRQVRVAFRSPDVPIVNALVGPEVAHTFPAPLAPVPGGTIEGFAFNAYNNIWETNYIMWYPYLPGDENFKARFAIDITEK